MQLPANIVIFRRLRLVAGLAACALAAACSTLPGEPDAPAMAVPQAWKTAPAASGWASVDQAQAWSSGQWWRLFEDPMLDGLVAQLQEANQDIRQAAARVAQAEAALREQQAAYWPDLDLGLGEQRSGGDDRATTRSASLSLEASWAPDLWGRVQGSVAAQEASLQASRADLAGVRLASQAALAQSYLALRQSDSEIRLMQGMVQAYERAVQITRNRYDVGVTAKTDLLQAQTTLRNAQGSLLALQRARQNLEHAIAVLLGQAPASFSLPATEQLASLPVIPADLPATLLLRRPDVASAQQAVTAANTRIGVARSAYFPDVRLSAGLGAAASHIPDLLSAPQFLWSLGLQLAQPLFDGGARTARVDQAIADWEAQVARYRQTSLEAMREVEDALADLHTLDGEIAHTQAAADLASQAEQQMLNRYQAGMVAYTDVVTAQASALSARRSLLQLQLQRQQATVALIAALGGGWQGLEPAPLMSQAGD